VGSVVVSGGNQDPVGRCPTGSLIEGSRYRLKDGTTGEIRVVSPGSHWRLTRQLPDPSYPRASTIQIRIIPHKDRSVLAFHEEHLPSEKARKDRKFFYLKVTDELKVILE